MIVRRISAPEAKFDVVGLSEIWAHAYQNELGRLLAPEFQTYSFQEEKTTSGSAGI